MDVRATHLSFKSWVYYNIEVLNCYEFLNNDMEHINKGDYKVVQVILTLRQIRNSRLQNISYNLII
jgi:hypothetical protein